MQDGITVQIIIFASVKLTVKTHSFSLLNKSINCCLIKLLYTLRLLIVKVTKNRIESSYRKHLGVKKFIQEGITVQITIHTPKFSSCKPIFRAVQFWV